jgi:SAM-dependent methyltransferase
MAKTTAHNVIGAIHGKTVFNRRTRVLASRIEPMLPKDACVLDVGTGDGTIASLWQRNRPDLRIEGIDVLVRNDTKIPVRAFDGRTIPFDDNTWDVVTFVDVLHHTLEVEHLLREAARVARSWVVIKDHFAESAVDRATLRFMDWVGNAPHGVVLPYNNLPRVIWRQTFAQAMLELRSLDERIPLYTFPFSLVFGRGLHFIAQLRPSSP